MMKSMKLATKISVGFGLLIAIAVALGGMAVYNMNNVAGHTTAMKDMYVEEVAILSQLERRTQRTMYNMRGYAMSENKKYLEQGMKDLDLIKSSLADAQKLSEKYSELVKLRTNILKGKEKLATYEEMAKRTVAGNTKLGSLRKAMSEAAKKYMENCNEYLNSQTMKAKNDVTAKAEAAQLQGRIIKITRINEVISLNYEMQVINFQAQSIRDTAMLESALKKFPVMEKKFAELVPISEDPIDIERLKKSSEQTESYKKAIVAYLETWKGITALSDERGKVADELLALVREASYGGIGELQRLAKDNVGELNTSSNVMLIGLAVALVVGILLAVFITISITRPINRVISGLAEGAAQVTSASTQVSSASQTLAEGAAEQAASLEETSASMEEMSSMTQKNAENAKLADNLMNNSSVVVNQANNSMKELKTAMDKITSASEETSKIIKTIDEIAFQTNLLALNAAVEAARAGEAGAGFAVVADEVRNLAMRAAEAAKNTSELIEGNIKNIGQGSSLVQQTDEAFDQVIESSSKIAELVSEIAAASQEQSQGISQVNLAMTEMDKVTQQNAASAEESAAASEELSAQAMTMDGFVADLGNLVGGGAKARGKTSGTKMLRAAKTKKTARALPAPMGGKIKMPDPKKEIPFEDEDFKDF